MRFFLLLLFGLTWACSPSLYSHFGTGLDIQQSSSTEVASMSKVQVYKRTRDAISYIPDTTLLEATPMRYIRVNVHFMRGKDSSRNYVGEEALKFARSLVWDSNGDLKRNDKMLLPIGNNTPVLPTRLRLKLTPQPNIPGDEGIYFHTDEDYSDYVHKGKNRNLYDREVFKKYGVGTDSILNIFLIPHHRDSVLSKSYGSGNVGVALGTNVKLSGKFSQQRPAWQYRQILVHEVGHVLGLMHTWGYEDGCADTPKHPNCWNYDKNRPGCDSLQSNNVMDYNANQIAWTPCQIGRVHRTIGTLTAKARKVIEPTWCTLQPDYNILIQDSVTWLGHKDLQGHIRVASGATLRIGARISLPKDAEIIVEPDASLILDNCQLHNACGHQWKGIKIETLGKRKGEIILIGETKLENMQHPLVLATDD